MSSTIDDTHLLRAWQDHRDAESFRVLCERYAGLIEATCRRHGSPDTAEAVQAVFLVMARRAGSVTGSQLGAWLTTTAQRVVKDQHRAATSRRRHEQEAAVKQARQRAADGADPSWEEARQHLDAALASLSAGRREAILRFYLAGQPQAEVAAELGCSVSAVKMRVHEGLEGLRKFFARKGIALGGVALASGLASEATASDPTLVATCVQTVLTPAAAPGAAALAHGVITAMIVKTATLIAAGLVLAGSCLTAALVVGAESAATPVAASAPRTGAVVITPRGGEAIPALTPPAQPAPVAPPIPLSIFGLEVGQEVSIAGTTAPADASGLPLPIGKPVELIWKSHYKEVQVLVTSIDASSGPSVPAWVVDDPIIRPDGRIIAVGKGYALTVTMARMMAIQDARVRAMRATPGEVTIKVSGETGGGAADGDSTRLVESHSSETRVTHKGTVSSQTTDCVITVCADPASAPAVPTKPGVEQRLSDRPGDAPVRCWVRVMATVTATPPGEAGKRPQPKSDQGFDDLDKLIDEEVSGGAKAKPKP
jgi:RNA polymerase sigma factor (sigma-70 family)